MALLWVQHSTGALQTKSNTFWTIRQNMTNMSEYDCFALAVEASQGQRCAQFSIHACSGIGIPCCEKLCKTDHY